eukprot:scaffold140709_cov20-Tisochrysis_lutea.AAC.2
MVWMQAYYKDMPLVPYPATVAPSCPSTHIVAPHSCASAPLRYHSAQPEAPHSSVCIPLRRHGDELQRLPGGYYTARGRVDDTMNLGRMPVRMCVRESVCVCVSARKHALRTPKRLCASREVSLTNKPASSQHQRALTTGHRDFPFFLSTAARPGTPSSEAPS